jgi:predicted transcriptional regulator
MEENTNTEEDWWDTISQQERDDIEEGLEDIRNGRTVPYEEMRNGYNPERMTSW